MRVSKRASLQVSTWARGRVCRSASWVLPVVVSLLALAVTVGCSEPSVEELVAERCTACHALSVVEASQKTPQEWEETVNRMVDHGARLDDQQAQKVIDYLSDTYGVESP